MHYRGFGQSTGRTSEAALHADARAHCAHARRDHGGIEVAGRGLGSGVAMRLASEQPVTLLALIPPRATALSRWRLGSSVVAGALADPEPL